MPAQLREWKDTFESRVELVIEEYMGDHQKEIELALAAAYPELLRFMEGLQVVRWQGTLAV
jgi:hypothetical protein